MAGHTTNGAAPLPAAGGSRRAVSVISLISWPCTRPSPSSRSATTEARTKEITGCPR